MTANLAVKLYHPNDLLNRDTQRPKIARKLSERCENQFTGEKTTIFKHMSYPVLTDFSNIRCWEKTLEGSLTGALKTFLRQNKWFFPLLRVRLHKHFMKLPIPFGNSMFFSYIYIVESAKVGYFGAFRYSKKWHISCFWARIEHDGNL